MRLKFHAGHELPEVCRSILRVHHFFSSVYLGLGWRTTKPPILDGYWADQHSWVHQSHCGRVPVLNEPVANWMSTYPCEWMKLSRKIAVNTISSHQFFRWSVRRGSVLRFFSPRIVLSHDIGVSWNGCTHSWIVYNRKSHWKWMMTRGYLHF